MNPEIDRRELLRAAGIGAAGVGLLGVAGCGSGDGTANAARGETATIAVKPKPPRTPVRVGRKLKKGDVPNLLLVIIDSVRADALGSYGRRNAHTPNLDALARESLRFTECYPESFPTGPARATIFGGSRLFPFRDWKAPADMPGTPGWQAVPDVNLISTLRRAGYWTGFAVDTPWVMVGSQQPFLRDWDRYVPVKGQTGTVTADQSKISDAELAKWVAPKIIDSSSGQKMRQYLANQLGRRNEDEYLPARVFTEGMRLLEEGSKSRKPFAIAIDCFDPHEPWDPPERYLKLHGGDLDRAWNPGTVLNGTARSNGLAPRDVKQMQALYYAELTMADRWFGNFMQRFHELGLERDTIVMFLSDHGFLLGERGYVAKFAWELHPELTHVPMLLRRPDGTGARKKTDFYAQTEDVAATLLGATGIKQPEWMDGIDLMPLSEGKKPKKRRDYVTGSYSSVVFARDRNWSYIADSQGGRPELYNLRRDRREVRNLAGSNAAQVRKMYRGMLVRDAGGPLPKFT
ncbi:sulfatase family protein [Conexibacter woesei]|uniref:Sulfatase n=1 Tax=Conexibacter woesei (strain DSM 14684 / CCUG 47730 / CIP 108061 / JCM 11494 / NBRC 100937 / ID131577) TaxID=469383 RepID=D3FA65_CONWI|nr:sulfatase [Conexibacter woesei]ADB53160.1 sulfatase [Conexibacter woesei DSM 14684]